MTHILRIYPALYRGILSKYIVNNLAALMLTSTTSAFTVLRKVYYWDIENSQTTHNNTYNSLNYQVIGITARGFISLLSGVRFPAPPPINSVRNVPRSGCFFTYFTLHFGRFGKTIKKYSADNMTGAMLSICPIERGNQTGNTCRSFRNSIMNLPEKYNNMKRDRKNRGGVFL